MIERDHFYQNLFTVMVIGVVLLQGVKMDSMRFRFDGNPINETDTPAGVSGGIYKYFNNLKKAR